MIRRAARKARSVLARLAGPPPPPAEAAAAIEDQLRLTDARGHPNINPMWQVTKDLEAMRLNIKMLGYSLAGALEARLQAVVSEPQSRFILDCKACTQADIESRWFRYWCDEMQERSRFHRRLWEYAYTLQGLNAAGALEPGARVLALVDAAHPIPSYLAGKGVKVTLAHGAGAALPEPGGFDRFYDDRFADRPDYLRSVEHRSVDFGALPAGLEGYDALYSVDLAGRRGSIERGMAFVRAAMGALKPGGMAVHIFDFNYANDAQTIDDWGAVLLQRRHFEALRTALEQDGHEPSAADFSVGFQEMDRFVDLPPFDTHGTPSFDRLWRDGWQASHLKVMVDGFAVTSFGILVRKAR